MWTVALALIPAGLAGVYVFGFNAFLVILVCVGAALGSEALYQKLMGHKITIADGSAFITGLLLAYNLSPSLPLWQAAAGSIFAVIVGKMVFGGLGHNIFNPALIGRAFLLASWPLTMTSYTQPVNYPFSLKILTSATPLALLKEGRLQDLEDLFKLGGKYYQLFYGMRPGCIGEVSALLLILGGLYLIIRGYINWQIPAGFIGTVGLLSWIFGGKGLFSGDPFFHMMSGGLLLGAFFMATDYVTIPLTLRGRIIFGIGCGVITVLIRLIGGYPEGVCYAILLMNSISTFLDRRFQPPVFGVRKGRGEGERP
jgi:electron transport complex protein RnfD